MKNTPIGTVDATIDGIQHAQSDASGFYTPGNSKAMRDYFKLVKANLKNGAIEDPRAVVKENYNR